MCRSIEVIYAFSLSALTSQSVSYRAVVFSREAYLLSAAIWLPLPSHLRVRESDNVVTARNRFTRNRSRHDNGSRVDFSWTITQT